ncbi:MAG: dihydroorotate dehydrogenase electron transfer subunit, partial [Dehalococcoidia bacterium]|nr:dihydroorotate dehydrogenase electron transfer subunit [Dehalococcoidia bacterium]
MIPAGPQIKLLEAPVLSNRTITPGSYILSFQAAEIAGTARPGQFVMVRCGTGSERVLRRPLGIHRVNFTGPAKGEVSLLYSVVGSGTRWLSELKAGEYIDILGPLGNGFSLGPANRRLLLVAGGIGFSPLNFLAAEAVKKSIKVTLLLGAGTARDLYPEELLPQDIEPVMVTEDGSAGKKGLVTDYLKLFLPGVDQVCA